MRLSKKLSYVLRHGANEIGLNISKEGYISVNEIMNHNDFKSLKLDIKDIISVVETNDKKRFELK